MTIRMPSLSDSSRSPWLALELFLLDQLRNPLNQPGLVRTGKEFRRRRRSVCRTFSFSNHRPPARMLAGFAGGSADNTPATLPCPAPEISGREISLRSAICSMRSSTESRALSTRAKQPLTHFVDGCAAECRLPAPTATPLRNPLTTGWAQTAWGGHFRELSSVPS